MNVGGTDRKVFFFVRHIGSTTNAMRIAVDMLAERI